jgi:hypothetical protein
MDVASVLRRLTGTSDPRTAARKLSAEVRHVCLGEGLSDVPLGLRHLQQIAIHCGVKKFRFRAPIPSEGLIEPLDGGGFCLSVARAPSTARARFTIAHEIAHTFFYSREYPARPLVASERRLDFHRQRGAHADAEEAFCDIFAAELLMPGSAAISTFADSFDVVNAKAFLTAVEQVGVDWGLSVQTVLGRMNDVQRLPGDFLIALLRRSPHVKTGLDVACRVSYVLPKPARGWYLPSNQRAASIGLAGAVALDNWWFEGRRFDADRAQPQHGAFGLRFDERGRPAPFPCNTANLTEHIEQLQISTRLRSDGRWLRRSVALPVVYRFYAVSPKIAYCVAVIDVGGVEHTSIEANETSRRRHA